MLVYALFLRARGAQGGSRVSQFDRHRVSDARRQARAARSVQRPGASSRLRRRNMSNVRVFPTTNAAKNRSRRSAKGPRPTAGHFRHSGKHAHTRGSLARRELYHPSPRSSRRRAVGNDADGEPTAEPTSEPSEPTSEPPTSEPTIRAHFGADAPSP